LGSPAAAFIVSHCRARQAEGEALVSGPARPGILLLDGHSLAYRAFFALPADLATKTGQVTNAVYGFTSMLIKLLADQKTDRIAVAFDVGRPTQRLAEYAEYKAGRRETPDDFRSQLPILREVLETLEIPIVEMPEYEADDVLATLARRACESGFHAMIVTADRDFMQMVRPGISVLSTRTGISEIKEYDPAAVEERFGLPPEKYIDLVALKGDPSDNLPGIPGIGDKTAADLVKQFGSIEEMYERLDGLPKRIQRLRPKIEAAQEQVLRNKKLARLVDDLPVEIELDDVRMGPWDMERVRTLFLSLEFRSLLERLPDRTAAAAAQTAAPFVVRTGDAASVEGLTTGGRIGAMLDDGGRGVAISTADTEAVWFENLTDAAALLSGGKVDVVSHDGKRLAVAMARRGLPAPRVVFDTEIAAYLLDPAAGRYELAELSQRYLGRDLPTSDQSGDDAQLSFSVEGPPPAEAACAAAAALLPLATKLESELDRLGMLALYRDVELPLVDVLARMEEIGVAIDTGLLEKQSAELGAEIAVLEKECYELAGGPFNLNSPPQLREVLYDRLKLTPGRRTKTGYSTDAAALESLRDAHPIVDALLRYRELSKLKSTYLDALPRLCDPETGRLHPKILQTVAATGRLSTSDPNVQNIPVRTELGLAIRGAFVAPPGHLLLVADYSQIELRVLAHVTEDSGLTEAFARDEDIHAATAARVWGFDVADVPRDLRNRAKMINYGLSYGMSPFGLAQRLGIATDEAAEFVEAYFKGFPGVKDFMERVVREAYRDGYTVTLLGRRRYLPELENRNPRIRSLGERQALNAPIQGSAADIIKLAMLRADRGLEGTGARMVLSVHDELVFEVPSGALDATTERVRSLMEQAYPLKVPLKVDLSSGPTWADAKG
jgi:DNA polymerase-1